MCPLSTHFGESFFSWIDAKFYQMPFLLQLRWSCGFCLFLCWCGISHWFACVEPSLWLWNESNLTMVYAPLYVLLGCLNFIEDFCIFICQRYWRVIFFFVVSLFLVSGWIIIEWLWIEWLWECSLLLNLLE